MIIGLQKFQKRAATLFALAASVAAWGQDDSMTAVAADSSMLTSPDGRTFMGRLAPHEPIYFLYGTDDPAAKFQFSFKYALLFSKYEEENASKARNSLNIAYTQRSLWDIEADSSPFYDTEYMPELFLESSNRVSEQDESGFTWFGYQAGVRHTSNGRAGSSSRSYDVAYLRPVFSLGSLESWHVILSPEVFFYITDLEDNPDLAQYRGYTELRGAIRKSDGISLGYTVRAGKEFERASYQVDLTFPVQIDYLNLGAYFHVQYFDGYGESLLFYTEKSQTWRFGISLVR